MFPRLRCSYPSFLGSPVRLKGFFRQCVAAVALVAASTAAHAQILQNGYSVVACKPQGPDNVTLAVKDITQFGTIWSNPANRGDDFDWSSQMPGGMMWTRTDFGGQPVLSMTIDSRDGSIYTITTRGYDGFTAGPAWIYKIDAMTGATSQIAQLPGNLGGTYIEIDEVNDQLFAVDMDTGIIHRVSTTGALLSDFDPGAADDGSVGLPVHAERVFGVTYNPVDNRVYYSIWGSDRDHPGTNTVRSVALDAGGEFVPATDRLEISTPAYQGSGASGWSSPVGDIEFNAAGDRVLLAENGYRIWTNSSGITYVWPSPHVGRLLEYYGSGGAWTLEGGTTRYGIGEVGGDNNARGGVDWAYESIISPAGGIVGDENFLLATTDGFNLGSHSNGTTFNVYGYQFTPTSGGNVEDSVGADLDYNTVGQDKNIYSDVDVYKLPIEYDLALIKEQLSLSQTPAAVGTQVTYRITVKNQGAVASGSYTVDENIPTGMSFVSATPDPASAPSAGSGGLVQWVVPASAELAAGATANFDVVLRIDNAAASPFKNTAEISADSGAAHGGDSDSDPTDNSDVSDTFNDSDVNNDEDPGDEDDSDFEVLELVAGEYDLALIKRQVQLSESPAKSGTQVMYEIVVMNQGDVPSSLFEVTETIPAGMTFVSASPTAASAPGVGSGGVVRWVTKQLQPLDQTAFEIVLEVADTSKSPFRNFAEITSDSGDDDDSDPSDGSGATDTFDDPDVTNDEDKGDEDDSDFAELEVAQEYDLALIKQLVKTSETPATIGTQVVYEITVMNQGDVPSDKFEVTETIPTGMTFVSASPVATTDPDVGSDGSVTWVVEQLKPTDKTTFQVVLEIADVTQSPFHNIAEITGDSGDDSDSDPADGSGEKDTFDDEDVTNDQDKGDEDDSDFADLEVKPDYDLALIKQLVKTSDSPATLGTRVVYEITVMNQGNVPSDKFEVTEAIPAGMTFVSAYPVATTDPGVGSGGTVTWVIEQLKPTDKTTFQVELEIADVAQSPFHNIAEITGDSGDDSDSDPADGSGEKDTFDDEDVTNDQDKGDEDDSDFADLEVKPDYDLALIKQLVKTSESPATLGTQVVYEITVMNQGNVPSDKFEVTEAIPAGMTFVSASPVATTAPEVGSDGSVTWVVEQLKPTDKTTFQVVLEIADVTRTPFHNIAEITADSGDDSDSDPTDGSGEKDTFDDEDVTNDEDKDDEDDSDFADLEVKADYDLALIKQLVKTSESPATLGTEVVYEITVMNQGNVPSDKFEVTEAIPAGMTFVSASPVATTDPGVGSGGTVTWVVEQLKPTDKTTFQIVLEIADVSKSPYHNIAEITADSGDDNDSDPTDGSGEKDTFDDEDVTNDEDKGDEDDSDFADLEVKPDYDLALIKQLVKTSDNPATLGTQVAYEITVMNQGNVPSDKFEVTEAIPAGMTFVSASPVATTAPEVGSGGAVTWVIEQLKPTDKTTFQVVLEIADVTQSPYHNIAEITADSGDDNDSDPSDGSGEKDTFDDEDVTNDQDKGDQDDSDFADLEVKPDYDLALIKQLVKTTDSPATLGTEVVYEITVMNQGNVPSDKFEVTEAIPAGMTFVSASPVATTDPGVGSGGAVTWVVEQLKPTDKTTFQVVLEIADVTRTPFHNIAEITADSGDDNDSDPTDGSGSKDTFDDEDVTNDEDKDDEDDSDFADLEVKPDYDLALIKQLVKTSESPATLGTEVVYEITVMNQGNVPSDKFEVTEVIPAGMTFVSASPVATTAPEVGSGGSVTWVVEQLKPTDKTTFQVVLKISDVTRSPFHNIAEITGDSGDDNDSDPTDGSGSKDTFDDEDVTNDEDKDDEDDSDFADLEVKADYDLALIKQLVKISETPATLGTQVAYEITVMNQGNVPSDKFEVTEAIPAGMIFVSASPVATSAPAVGSGGTVTWVLEQLNPADKTTFQVVLEIADVTQSPFHNIAEITGDSGDDSDSDPTDGSGEKDTFDDEDVTNDEDKDDEDDSDFADLEVKPDYDLALIKQLVKTSESPATLGTQVAYEITVMNQGNVPSDKFEVTEAIPAGMTFVSASPVATTDPGVGSGGSVTWVLEQLKPTDKTTFQVVLEIADVTQSPFHNIAEITADSGDDNDSDPTDGSGASDTFDDEDVTNDEDKGDEDDSDFADLEVKADYDLALIKQLIKTSDSPATLGTQVAYEITVMNQGNVPSDKFEVTEAIPAGMTFVSASPVATTDPGVGSGGAVTWVVEQLKPTDKMTFQVVLEIADVTQSPYHNIAEITADSGDDNDSDPSDGSGEKDTFDDEDVTNDEDKDDEDDSDFADLEVKADYDLALIKQLIKTSETPATLGTQVAYEITVMNQGNVPSDKFEVTETIPAGMTFVSANPVATSAPAVGSGGTVAWVIEQLKPTDKTTFQVVLEIADVTQSPYHNIAEITADSGDDNDSDPADGSGEKDTFDDEDVTNDEDKDDEDDSDFADLEVKADYDLALIKQLVKTSDSPATLGTEVVYEITVMNQGNVPSDKFEVTETIPAGMTFVSANPVATSAPAVGSGGTVTWVVEQLKPTDKTTFQVVLEIADVTQSPYHNIAEITGDSGDDNDSDPTDGSGEKDTFDDEDVTNDEDKGDEDDSDFADLEVKADYDLALIKEQSAVSTSPATLGTQVTYDITVMNQGNVPSDKFEVTDSIPAGMTFVSASPAAATDPGVGNGGSVTWVTGQLKPGDKTTLQVVLKVADVTLSPYRNNAEITADSGDDNDSDPTDGSGAKDTFDDSDVSNDKDADDEDDSDFETLIVDASYDLALIKQQTAVSESPATLGTKVTYTISVMNQGNVPSGSYSVTDNIPAGMGFVSASPAPASAPASGSTGPVVWNVGAGGQLGAGAQSSFQIVLEVVDVTLSPYHNTAEISADSGASYGGDEDSDPTDGSADDDTFDDADVTNDEDPGDEDDSDFADLSVDGVYDLALIKEVKATDPSPAQLGSTVTYEITVMNQGNVPSAGFSVADAIPAGMGYVSSSPAPTVEPAVGSSGNVEWVVSTLDQLKPGATKTFEITASIDDVTQAPYHNIAQITADSGEDKDSDPTDGSGSSDTFDDSDVSNDQDPGDQDDSDFADVKVAASYDLALIKEQVSQTQTPATLGTQVSYNITVMNQGNVPSGTFTVDELIPVGMTFVSASPAATTDPGAGSGGTVQWVVPASAELAPTKQAVFNVVLEISDVASSPFRNSAEISADSGEAFGGDKDSDPADGSAGSDTFDDSDVTNDQDPADEDDSDFSELEVDASYDLALIKDLVNIAPMPANLGSTLTYNITVMNQGNVGSGTFTVEDEIPAGLTFVSATPAATVDPGVGATGTVSWVVPESSSLGAGSQTTFVVKLMVDDVAMAPYRNYAEITADSGDDEDSDPTDGSGSVDSFDDGDVTNDNDPGDQDDSDFAETDVAATYDLALIKNLLSVNPSPAQQASQVSFEVIVMNQGNISSGAFTVTDQLPAALKFVSATPAASSDPGVGNSGAVTWNIPASAELAAGATTSFTIVAEVEGGAGSVVRNIADITSDSGGPLGGDKDSNPGDGSGSTDTFDDSDVTNDEDPGDEDDSDFAELEIPGVYDLALVKKLSPGQNAWISENQIVEYDIFVKNQGDIPSGTFTVVDTLPGGMSFVSATGKGMTCVKGTPTNSQVQCDYTPRGPNALAPGAMVKIKLSLRVDDISMAPFHNWAEITADSGDDMDSSENTNGAASDPSDGGGTGGADPVQDHDDIDHSGIAASDDEDDSDIARVFAAQTTPITLQSFEASDVDGSGTVNIQWSTSMEDGNAGFYLYGRVSGGEWQRLDEEMIPAAANADNGSTYSRQLDATGKTEFAITDVDLFGAEVVHGPYKLGQSYGTGRRADKPAVVEDGDESEAPIARVAKSVYLDVVQSGIHRVTYEELKAAGYDYRGSSVSDLAVSLRGEAIAIRVSGQRNSDDPYSSAGFGPGGFIEFVAEEHRSIYSKVNRYILSVDSALARRVEQDYSLVPGKNVRPRIAAKTTQTWAPNVAYSRVSPIDDPWYADRIVTFKRPKSSTYNIKAARVGKSQPGRLRVELWSSYDDPDLKRDHNVIAYVNGVKIDEVYFGGIAAATLEGEIPAGILRNGNNEVVLELPMRGGRKLGQIFVESIEIDYLQRLSVVGGTVEFSMSNAAAVDLPGLTTKDVSVYRKDENGLFQSRLRVRPMGSGFAARLSGVPGLATWYVADRSGRKSVRIKPVPKTDDLFYNEASYVAIAHPKFMTQDLSRLLQTRGAEGFTTATVDVRKLYAKYTGGIVDPEAIRLFLKEAAQKIGTRYVLLVGGDTYDPYNNLGIEKGRAKSYVPTLYAPTGQTVKHAPVDPMLGDIDEDGVPDLIIGRMAVQTKGQLKAMVDKTLAYPYAGHAGRAMMVSDGRDDGSRRSFKKIGDFAFDGLGDQWRSQHLSLEDLPIGRIKNRLKKQINEGLAITSWVGHSDRNVWGFDGVFTTDEVSSLTNAASPTIVTQWGCWNNYYVDPQPNTMTYRWLVSPNSGAAMSIGSTTLMEAGSERILARKVFEGVSAGKTIGEAIHDSKLELVKRFGVDSTRDLLGGFVILGDPAMRALGR